MAASPGNIAVPDFRAEIRLAAGHAVPLGPVDPFQNEAKASKYVNQPDGHVIRSFFIPQPTQVYTNNPDYYGHLLRQALEVTGTEEGSSEQLPLARENRLLLDQIEAHELIHGRAARIGGQVATSHYGLEFFVDEDDGSLDFWPFHTVSGLVKKVHHAWTAAAPEDRSDIDKQIVAGLGYDPDNIHDLYRRAQAEPPLEPTPNLDYSLLDGSIKSMFAALLQEYIGPA